MSITQLGDYPTGATVYVPFHTFDSNDPSASVTITGLAVTDIEIYKDGSATTRSSDSGYALLDTDGIDFASTTGLHGFSIDLSDNTDAGFFAAGSQYWVAVASITVDAATVNMWAGIFTIAKTGGAATILTDTEAVLTDSEAIITDTEAILVDTEAAAAVLTDTEAILADTNELQTDWTDAGRLDAILDAVLVDTEAAAPVLTDTEAILTDSEAILTDSEAILVDTEAVATGVNVTQISGSTTAANKLEEGSEALAIGTVNDGSPSTTSFVIALTGDTADATDDHYNGRIITFTSGVLLQQSTDITDYDGGTLTVTVTALTEAPGNTDQFVIS